MPDSATIASAVSATPFYRDWTFWSSAIAFVALAFSVGPLIWKWLRPPKLELHLYDRIALTHKVGNPNLQAHFIVRNVGGREVRVTSVTASITRDGGLPSTLPALNWQIGPGQTLVFTPFTLRSRDQWANLLNFIAPWGRENEQRYRRLQYALQTDIDQKAAQRPPANNNQLVEADPTLVAPLIEMYQNNNNRWQAGQYELAIVVTTPLKRVRAEQRYRFTLFETDAEELRLLTEDYKWGFGIHLNNPMRDASVYPEVTRV